MLLGANFIKTAFATLFIDLFDNIVYLLVNAAYTVFIAISRINLFATEGGGAIYSGFMRRLYMVLSVVMVFVFAYQMILMIINPDGEIKKSTSLIKDTIISLIFVAIFPWIFNQLAVFQDHVLSNGTIPAIVLGTSAADDESPGKNIALMSFISMYHPVNTSYSSFFLQGQYIGDEAALANCTASASSDVCNEFIKSVKEISNKPNATIGPIARNTSLYAKIGEDDGMEYIWILSTLAGALVVWFFISYSIDLGTRAVKLGVLQIIAPIPMVMRIFPQTKKTFETWFGEMKKTYIEVFLRVGIVSFIVYMLSLVPEFLNAIFNSFSGIEGNLFIYCFATIALILGLLKFAKEAPSLFKTLFTNGSNLFEGLNFKPGVRKRVEDNEYAMKGINTLAQGGAGMIGNAMRKYNYERNRVDKDGNPVPSSRAGALGRALLSTPRGLVTGAKSGFKSQNKSFSRKALADELGQGLDVAQASGARADLKHEAIRQAREKSLRVVKSMPGANVLKFGPEYLKQMRDNYYNEYFDNAVADIVANRDKALERLTGRTGTTSSAGYQTLSGASSVSKSIVEKMKNAAFNDVDAAGKDALKSLRTDGKVMWEGKNYDLSSALPGETQEQTYARVSKELDAAVKTSKTREQLKKVNDGAGGISRAGQDIQRDAEKIFESLSKNIGTLSQDTINQLNSKTANNDVLEFLKNFSTKTTEFTADDIETFKKINTTLGDELAYAIKPNEQPKSDSSK